MKILIFGKGYLGNRMAEAWPNAVLSDVRIDDKQAVLKALDEHQPDAVVNTAGKTGKPNVDWCEMHQTETASSNIIGPLVLAEACGEKHVYLVHLSSGCIFYGPSPDPKGWTEDDFANPESFYSRTKYASDLVLSRMPNVAIVRLRMPIDHVPSSRNLIDKLANYKQVIDVENSVTIIEDLLMVIYQLIQKKPEGIFHAVNPGTMRHRDLINLYREYVDPNHSNEWIENDELIERGLAVAKRSNCILQSRRLEELGIYVRPISIALRETMMKYGINKRNQSQQQNELAPMSKPAGVPERGMKGVILAGGLGTRLMPLTSITNKHLLPIHNKPMVLYPLQTLLDSGIRNIMLVTGPEYAHQFMKLLGSGKNFGCEITYRIQDTPGGISHALSLAKDFVGDDNVAAILGDNIFDEDFSGHLRNFSEGALAFYKHVPNARDYGVLELADDGRVLSIEEKPSEPKSNFAQVGMYVYDPSVFDAIKGLVPSARNELEVTDLNNHFLRNGKLTARELSGPWWDAGSFAGMSEATHYFAGKNSAAPLRSDEPQV